MQRRLLGLMLLVAVIAGTASTAHAAVGLTTVPHRDGVRLTIYNSVDLTLAQERRTLVLREGENRIQYQWAGTLIDSTSVQLRALEHRDDIEIIDVIYPQGAPATLIWRIESDVEGEVPFEISYFTSGLSWSADYTVRASVEERTADMEGHVAVINNSGEDYPDAEVRLVVGTINLVENIRDLATGQIHSRTRPVQAEELRRNRWAMEQEAATADMARAGAGFAPAPTAPPEVVSQRLAEYHIFTIGGRQEVRNGATTRFLAIENEEAFDLEVLYRVNFMNNNANKIYRFINNEDHHLPDGPLPEGVWHVFRQTDATGSLSYSGSAHHAYVPPNQRVELGLGHDPGIAIVQRQIMERQTDFHYDRWGRVDGWIQHRQFTFRLVNTKPIPVSVEYIVHTGGGNWVINGLTGERRDTSTYRHQAQVPAGDTLDLGPFTISTRMGVLANQQGNVNVPTVHALPPVRTTP